MNPKTQMISYYNIFPKNRDFFLLDIEDNIKQFKTTTTKDPEYIYVAYESKKEKKTCEKICRRKDFLSDYEFIRVNSADPNVYINFIIPKNKFNNGRETRLLTEIKQRKYFMEDIFRKTKINFDTKDSIIFKESFSVQNELKFYNRVFYFIITKQKFVPAPFNQRANNNNSFASNNNNHNNNNFQNNNFNRRNNNNKPFFNGGNIIINNFNNNNNNNPVRIFNKIDNQDINSPNREFINMDNNTQGYNSNNFNHNVTTNNINNNYNFPSDSTPHQKNSFPKDNFSGKNNYNARQNFSKEGQNFIPQGQLFYQQGHNQQPQQGQNQPQSFQNLTQYQQQGGQYQQQGGQNQQQGGQYQQQGGQYQQQGGQYQQQGGQYQQQGGQNQQQGGQYQQQGGQYQQQGGQYQQQGGQYQQQGGQYQQQGFQYQQQGGQNPQQGGQYPQQGGQYPQQGGQNPQQGGQYPQQGGQYPQQGGQNQQQGGQYQPYGGQNQQQGGQNQQQEGQNQQQGGQNQQQGDQNPPVPPREIYIFPLKGLVNIGSTCYMNATLQCLLHVSELIVYFINEFPKDQATLNRINKSVPSSGDISRVFYNLVIGVYDNPINMTNSRKNLKPQTNVNKKKSWNIFNDLSDNLFSKDNNNAFSPKDFKKTLGLHNPQFKAFEANDSKDLILYLLQTLHEEMNYFGDKKIRLNYYPNQYDMFNTYQHFYTTYNSNNFSKISLLFYGTYINTTVCKKCNFKLYNFQKFEFISFGMYFYNKKEFNIMKGFEDNSKTGLLTGDNKFLCNNCKGLQDAETTCQIFEPPNKLLINIDYGKNKKYQPSSIKFDEEIDITPFIASNLNMSFKYRIIGVCTHYGHSGRYGHYVAFCRHREEKVWYEFNDSIVSKCNQKDIYRGSPYLLLYERII